MPKYLITLKNFKYKASEVPYAMVSFYKDKNTPKAAYNEAISEAVNIFGDEPDPSDPILGRYLYIVEEIPV